MEVSDSTARVDLKSKRLEYESAGVREYLVIDLSARRVHWFELAGEFFRPLEPDEDGIVRSRVFPGLWLDATALLDRRVDRVLAALGEGLATPEHAEFAARLSG